MQSKLNEQTDPRDLFLEILHGNISQGFPDPPSKIIKIFLCSSKTDFVIEKRQLYKHVFPELQKFCSNHGLDLLIIDPEWKDSDILNGNSIKTSGVSSCSNYYLDSYSFSLQLKEIEECYRLSIGTFFLCLIGNKYKSSILPISLDQEMFKKMYSSTNDSRLNVSLLNQWYQMDENFLTSCKYSLIKRDDLKEDSEMEQIIKIIENGIKIMEKEEKADHFKPLLSSLHTQSLHAMDLLKPGEENRILAFVRRFEEVTVTNISLLESYFDTTIVEPSNLSQHQVQVSSESIFGIKHLIEDLICGLGQKSIHFFNIPWDKLEANLSQDLDSCNPFSPLSKQYIDDFTNSVCESFKTRIMEAINLNISYFDYIPEIIRESHSCLCNYRKLVSNLGVSQPLESDNVPLLQLQKIMKATTNDKLLSHSASRHAPIVVVGDSGSGKSILLSQVFTYCSEWLSDNAEVIKMIRYIGQSPSSSYASELLRSLCIHLTLVYGFEMRRDIKYELSSLSIWFQDLLKLVETTATNFDLVIILDDLHALKSLQTSAILGWLPWNLPPNVHLICSVLETDDQVLNILKSKISSDNFIKLAPLEPTKAILNLIQSKMKDKQRRLTAKQLECVKIRLESSQFNSKPISQLYVQLLINSVLIHWHSIDLHESKDVPIDIQEIVNNVLNQLEAQYPSSIVSKIASYLTCTRYGLREVEIRELILSDDNISNFNVNIWLGIKAKLLPLLKEYYILGRPYLHWSHSAISQNIRKRYISSSSCLKRIHSELASAFLLGFNEVLQNQETANRPSRKDCFDILREIDELWYHLLKSEDIFKLKTSALLNINFLMTAVRSSSISYLRSMLELVKNQILDWEIELFYNMTKHAVSIVFLNTDQLATEILNWLKPFASIPTASSTDSRPFTIKYQFINNLVKDTFAWCNNHTLPFFIPITSWLHLSLPMQVSVISCPKNISRAVITLDLQNLIFCDQNYLHFFNLPSKSTFKTLKEHKGTITCIYISDSGRYLATGDQESSVIIWELDTEWKIGCSVKHHNQYHEAGVLCVTIAHSEELVLSGSEVGTICAIRISDGSLAFRLKHHSEMITCISINAEDDIFAAGSTDCSVSIWSLDDFCLLNQIFLSKAVMHMDISQDSTFLMLAYEDNRVNIRALTTGSEVHYLESHRLTSVISYLKFAEDNRRVILGTGDGKLFFYDVHSAKLIHTLTSHQDIITSIITVPFDKFLITCDKNKIIVWNFHSTDNLDTCLGCSHLCSSSAQSRPHYQGQQQRTQNCQLSINHNARSSFKAKITDHHREPVTCLDVSRDGTYAATGSKDALVKIWRLNTGEIYCTLKGHNGPITCIAFAPNGAYCVSGSEDNSLRVWGLSLSLITLTFIEHQSPITAVFVTNDSKRILSVDNQGAHRLWQVDTGNQITVLTKSFKNVMLFGNMVFSIGGKNDNSVKYWSVYEPEVEKSVSHSEPVTCYTCTYDCQTIITGSQDMSLKVWEVASAKITQVLVGHEEAVSCVASAPLSSSTVISGSQDCNLIVWDMTTGNVTFTLTGHTANVTHVKFSIDATVAISASEDNTIMAWEISETGQRIAVIDIHQTISSISTSANLNQVVVQLSNNYMIPIIKFHNNPAKQMPLEQQISTPDKKPWRGVMPNSVAAQKMLLGRETLRREHSLDMFPWDLHRGVSIDDFRKLTAFHQNLGSPMGSREHLATTGIIWDGTTNTIDRNILRLSRIGGKMGGPKQKMLKKQQSMFAFLPEYCSSSVGVLSSNLRTQSPLASPCLSEGVSKQFPKPSSLSKSTKSQQPPSRAHSLEETESTEQANFSSSKDNQNLNRTFKDSIVCSIS